MKISRLVTFSCFVTGGACLGQTPAPSLFDVVRAVFKSFEIGVNKVFSMNNKELRDFEDCGKRRVLEETDLSLNTCLWDCDWKHNPFYSTGVTDFSFDDVFPFENGRIVTVKTLITLPRIPKDLTCLSDCFLSIEVINCINCCSNSTCSPLYSAPDVTTCSFRCYAAFKTFLQGQTGDSRLFFASDYIDMAMEFCRISFAPQAVAMNLYEDDCSSIKQFTINKEVARPFKRTKSKNHRITSQPKMTEKKVVNSVNNNTRLFGSSIYPLLRVPDANPWLCSLRTRGFRGRHRCGVTLLSGPTDSSPDDPTILVGTAHCNYICKERSTGNIYETCCCRPASSDSSCVKTSSYCRGDPIFTLAEPSDLQIVCGEYSVESPEPEITSPETEVVLDILEIINHPDYKPNEEPGVGGPIEGNDISVYKVQDSNFRMTKGVVWPACLPKETYDPEFRGIIAGWQDSEPAYLFSEGTTLAGFRFSNFFQRQVQVEEVICRDPAWMNTNTYYPQGTVCYRDPSLASCVEFGVSGSGIVRKWREDPDDGRDQYAFVGPLTISKGCDLARRPPNFKERVLYRGENPTVVTDATCFMDWIAAQYKVELPQRYEKKKSCSQGKGDRGDINKAFCKTSFGTYCDFTALGPNTEGEGEPELWDSCRLLTGPGREGLVYNINFCIERGPLQRFANCANNCRGVDPNAIIGAGVAAVTAGALGAVGLLAPALGIGGIGMVGAAGGAIATRMATCQAPLCRAGNQCCRLVAVRGRIQCPSRC